MGKGVEVIFDVLIEDVRSLKTRRNSFEIDYTLLGKGQTCETRLLFKKRNFVGEDDNQCNASSEINHNRAGEGKSVIASVQEKAVEKHDKESLSQKLDNGCCN
ncbi:hypothetical protein HAX54_045663 [Datura stramonium]|uniref:Uncharacterized protein n=1 Tax=Datura stramonium TaxID=4076 RepID=A0ABS8RQ17_DATST|nr:hypothetical protein [Datura stramonium]